MGDVRRFTTRYVAQEDRIRLSVELASDAVQIYWLTRRLLNLLVPRLLERLDQSPSTRAAPRVQAQVAQKFSQQAAVSSLQKQKDVAPRAAQAGTAPVVSVVVTSLDIRHTKGGVVLDLKGGADVLQSLPFGENELRQWLNVVFRQYEAGGWHETFWPAWLRPETNVGADVPLN